MAVKQFSFGAGQVFATPILDAYGNPLANPTPVRFGTVQEASIEFSSEQKELFGSESQYPLAIANGKSKISGSIKKGQVQGEAYANMFFGQAVSNGIVSIAYDSVGEIVPATPFKITPVLPAAGVYLDDMGVSFRATGQDLKRVASAPTAGQYSVNVATGEYTFAAIDTGKVVFIHSKYTLASGGFKQNVVATPMGYTPSIRLDLYNNFRGKPTLWTLYNVVFNKMNAGSKLDDFAIEDWTFTAAADEAGNVVTYSTVG